MEETIYQRVKCILEDKSISVNALSKQINVAQATLNPQLRGDRTLAANIVEKILEAFPDVSAEWLMRGVGAMYIKEDIGYSSSIVEETPHFEEPKHCHDDSVWKAKYEAIKDCYDMLVSNLGGVMGKRSVG